MWFVRFRKPLGYFALFLSVLSLERLALNHGTTHAFFWPAAGIAALWLLSGRTRRQVVSISLALVAATTLLDLAMGVDLVPAALFGLSYLAVGLAIRCLSARFEHRPFWGPMRRRLARPRDLWVLLAAAGAGGLLSAVPGVLGEIAQSGSVPAGGMVLWVVRTTCSTFVVVAAVLGVFTSISKADAKRGLAGVVTASPRRFWGAELTLVGALSLASVVAIFGAREEVPLAYLMIVASTWVGCRFSPAVGGFYTLVLGGIAALSSQVGRGPFGLVEGLYERAAIVQIYAIVTSIIVLLLSLASSERAALITRVQESEARATSRADLLDAVTEVMVDGLFVIDQDDHVVLINPAAQAMAGLGPIRSEVGSPEQLGLFNIDGTRVDSMAMPRARALRGERVTPTDLLRIDPATGHQMTLSVTAVPLQAEDGQTLAVLSMRDVTTLHSQRRELENFAGVVAHDLKAPLTAVLSWAEILADQLSDTLRGGDQELVASVHKIRRSANRMVDLISDLLAYTQAQNAELSVQPVSLDELVDQVTSELQDTHHLEVPVVVHGPLGHVLADRTLIRQLLTNVMGNAVKYVAPGVIPHLVLESTRVEDMLEIWVNDNGLGIPDKDLGRVFDSFFRASSTSDYPGTGLGLAICARNVERHGGRISAREGIGGVGTTMIFTLPADPNPPSAASTETGAAGMQPRVDKPQNEPPNGPQNRPQDWPVTAVY